MITLTLPRAHDPYAHRWHGQPVAWHGESLTIGAGDTAEALVVLPTATYTRLVWQCDLHNLLHFLGLRLAPGAQLEMRRLAAQMAEAVARHFPWTWQAWMDLAAPAAVREMAEV